MIQVNQPAPKFNLEGAYQGKIKKFSPLSSRGKWKVIFFYPLDFTFVCPTEIKGFSRHQADFDKLDAEVYGISVDSVYSHQAWIEKDLGDLKFPLLSDITKKVSREYGVLLEDEGVALRVTFIVDPEGVLQYQVVHHMNVGRSVKETLRVLTALQTGELCPIEWTEKKKTLGKA